MGLMLWLRSLLTGSRFKALLMEGDRCLETDRTVDALKVFRQVVSNWPTVPDGYDGLSRTYLAMGFRPEAQREGSIADALRTITNSPNDFKAQYDLAKGYFEKEMYGWAATHVDNALKIKPNDSEALKVAAGIFRKNHNFSKAARVLRQSLRQEPFESVHYEQLAFCLRAMGKPQDALKAASLARLLKNVDADPTDPDTVSEAAYQLVNTSRPDLAENLVERSLGLSPDQPGLLRLRGELLVVDRKMGEAVDVLTRSISLDPTDILAHRALAKAYNALGEKNKAVRHLGLAKEMEQAQQGGIPAENQLAAVKMFLESGQVEKAAAVLVEMKKVFSHDWRSLYAQGLFYRNQGDLPKALAAFQKASQLEPQELRTYLASAEVLSDQGKPRLAVAEARRAVDMAPRDVAVRHFLSALLQKHGFMEKAIEEEDIAASLTDESK